MEIETMLSYHLDDVADLFAQNGLFIDRVDLKRHDLRYLVAIEQDCVVGALSFYSGHGALNIHCVVISPAFKGKGVIESFIEHLKFKAAAMRKINRLRIYIDENDIKSQKVFAGLGFESIAEDNQVKFVLRIDKPEQKTETELRDIYNREREEQPRYPCHTF